MSDECPSCGWPIIPPVLDDPRDAEIARLRKALWMIEARLELNRHQLADIAHKALEQQK